MTDPLIYQRTNISMLNQFWPRVMIKFKCKDFLMKECELEANGALRLSPETIEKIRTSLEKQTRL